MKIHIILGSTRQHRAGDKIANWIYELAQKQSDIEFELIDLRDWQLPMFDESMSPMANKGKWDSEVGAKWAQKVGEADGYIIVTPEYNHGYPAVLKNVLDYAFYEWNHKPFAFVAYSPVNTGAVRAVEQLAQVVGQLKGVSIVSSGDAVIIPNLPMGSETFDGTDYQHMADNMFTQLRWWATALKTAREADTKKL